MNRIGNGTGDGLGELVVVAPAEPLTPQEEQIARLAADGHSNPEIGAQLFLSPRTVEWHPRHVFVKLGIASRKGLRAALDGSEADELAAAPAQPNVNT